MKGRVRSNRREENKPKTPPNFLGIARRIAYANKKYHSGTICAGVTIGLAMMKLSGSPNRFGMKITNLNKIKRNTIKPTTSLIVKYQWNGTLSDEELTPSGLFLPVLCNNRMCITTVKATIIGVIKWNVKKRVSVALFTEKPPQIQITKSCPK